MALWDMLNYNRELILFTVSRSVQLYYYLYQYNSERSEVYISVEGELQVILIGRFSPNDMFGTRN